MAARDDRPWLQRLIPIDWEAFCNQAGCARGTVICPVCDHPAHRAVWVEEPRNPANYFVLIPYVHSHFLKLQAEARVLRRNCYHIGDKRDPDNRRELPPESFINTRKLDRAGYLPDDIRRIYEA